jgi:hypothetical protein
MLLELSLHVSSYEWWSSNILLGWGGSDVWLGVEVVSI